jgi:hypothetical protein
MSQVLFFSAAARACFVTGQYCADRPQFKNNAPQRPGRARYGRDYILCDKLRDATRLIYNAAALILDAGKQREGAAHG